MCILLSGSENVARDQRRIPIRTNIFFRCILAGIIVVEAVIGIAVVRKFLRTGHILGVADIADVRHLPLVREPGILENYYSMGRNPDASDSPPWMNGGVVRYSIQIGGVNRASPVAYEKNPGVFRLLAAGDSFTFGLYVNTADNYPSKLEASIASETHCPTVREYQVVNTGIPGYDIQFTIQHILDAGLAYDPDLIIWVIKRDDFERINQIVLGIEKSIREKRPNEDPLTVINTAQDIFTKHYPPESILFKQEQYLEKLFTVFSKPVVFVMPSDTPESMKNILYRVRDRHTNVYISSDWDFLPEHKLPDGHPTAEEHTRLARVIFDFLTAHRLLCPGSTP